MARPHQLVSLPITFLLTAAVSLTFLLGSARLGVAQGRIQFWSGQATISTANCSGAGGLCQPAPACNNGAGPNPDTISASVTLCEVSVQVQPIQNSSTWVGSGTLAGRGAGTGFRFGATYISVISFDSDTATCGSGTHLKTDVYSTVLGIWKVNPDGTATLSVDTQATVWGLNKYGTVSVREMQPPNATCFNCGLDPAPQLNALRACGALTITPATQCTLP